MKTGFKESKGTQNPNVIRGFKACHLTECLKADVKSKRSTFRYHVYQTDDDSNPSVGIAVGELRAVHAKSPILVNEKGKVIEQGFAEDMLVFVDSKILIGRGDDGGLYVEESV